MRYLLVLSLLLSMNGCTLLKRVEPYEKESLAKQSMLTTPLAEEAAFEGHVFGIREGSVGAESAFQGGCGCK